MRVALAEDGALFRDGLSQLLRAAGHDVVHAVPDGDALVEALTGEEFGRPGRADRPGRPGSAPVDVALLDIRMPPEPEGGLTTAVRLRRRWPAMGLLLLSHYAESHYLGRVLRIGRDGVGYRLKDRVSSVAALDDTLRRVAAGYVVIEPALAARLVGSACSQRPELGTLTRPERRTLQLLAAGFSDTRIAADLAVSRSVAEGHVDVVLARLALPAADRAGHNRRVVAVLRRLSDLASGD